MPIAFPTRSVQIKLVGVVVLLAGAFAAGCNDPYSRNRIAMREENLREFSGDVQNAEARRAKRLKEAGETLERWWQRDVDDFNRKVPTVGDYFW